MKKMFRSDDRTHAAYGGRKILITVLLLILWTAFLFPASANSGISNLAVKTHPSNDNYLTLFFDFTAGGKTYTTFVAGIRTDSDPDLWAEALAEEIAGHISAGKPLRIVSRKTGKANEYVLSGVDLMDVEKQNLQETDYYSTGEVPPFLSDSQLCWAAAASNALEISGWGRTATRLNPGKVDFKNEDDVFAYFANNVMDADDMAIEGVKWFLDGIQVDQYTDPDTGEPIFGVYHWKGAQLWEEGSGGLAKDICAADVASNEYDTVYYGIHSLISPTGLQNAADVLEKGYGIALGIEPFGMMAGHDLAMTGTVREKTSGGSGKVVAVFLADSDNDAPCYDYDDAAAAQAAGPRAENVNSFEMYPIREIVNEDATGVCIQDYWMWPEEDSMISNILSVRPYSADLPKDPEGTADVYASPDMVPVQIRLGEDALSYANTSVGIPLDISTTLHNQSYVPVTDNDSATVKLRYMIYRDGKQVGSVTKDIELTGKRLFPLSRDSEGTTVAYTFTEPGRYVIGVEIIGFEDADGPIREAYTHNNSLKNAFVIVEGMPPMPPTGDESGVVLYTGMLVSAMVLVIVLRNRRKRIQDRG